MSTGPESSPPPEHRPPAQPLPYSAPAPLSPDAERLWAIGAHLGPLLVGVLAPLVVWLALRDRSAFLDRTAKEALNFQISYLIYFAVAGLSVLLLVGLVLLPVVGIAWLVLMIVATVRVSSFEDYRYPAIFRFVS